MMRQARKGILDFYPDEYMLLEFLAIGATQDFIDLVPSPMINHILKNYGLPVAVRRQKYI